MEGREVTHTEKAYCCSNYPHTEAALIAKFELVLGAIGIVSTATTICVVANKDSSTQNQANLPNLNATNDPSLFFQWPRESQLFILSLCVVGKALATAFSILLLIGVKQKNHGYLLIWFIFTLINVLFSVISGIIVMIIASEKLMFSILFISSFLYNWYCLWIVKLLMSEIRAVREGYTNPLDDTEFENANNLVPNSDSFTVDKF